MDPENIPTRLRNRFFVKVGNGKKAFESFDVKEKRCVYSYVDNDFQDWLKKNHAYGVTAGYAHAVLDADVQDLVDRIRTELPPTFEVYTPGHKGIQFHYVCENAGKTRSLLDKTLAKKEQNIGHLKLGNGYGLGPGSEHPNGELYKVAADRPLAMVTEDQIHEAIAPWIAERTARSTPPRNFPHGTVEFTVGDLITGLDLKEHGSGRFQGSHPVHGSSTGANFTVDLKRNVWHCFRCESGGGPYQLLAVLRGVIQCEDSIPGRLRGQDFKKTVAIAKAEGLIKRPTLAFTAAEDKPQLTEDAEPHEVSEALLSIFHVQTIFKGETYVYRDGVYQPGGEATIRQIVETNFHKAGADRAANNHFLNEVLGHVQRLTYTTPEIFDTDPTILNLENGLFNVDTCELKPHTPEYPSLAKLPVRYEPTADCPGWKQFLRQVLHPEDLNAVQEFIGSLLWKAYPTQKAWLQIGEGANGKDTLDRVLTALLGLENVAHRSLQDLENNRFAKADLHGKLADIYSDLPDSALKTTGTFKTLTGEGRLAAEKKFQNAFAFNNYAKLIFSCNKIPLSPDDSDAFFRRWFITVFPNRFPGDDDDPGLVAKLTTSDELSGILNWAIAGLKRLRQQNWQLSQSRSVEEIRDDYIRKSDAVKAFVTDCCLPDPEGAAAKQILFQAFVKYCKLKKLPPVTIDTFYKRLPMAGVPISSAKLGPSGSRIPCFKGLSLRQLVNWGREAEEDEKPVGYQDKLDLDLGREKGGQDGHPGHETPAMSNLSSLSRGQPPNDEVDTEQTVLAPSEISELKDSLLKLVGRLSDEQEEAPRPRIEYFWQEAGNSPILLSPLLASLERDGLVFQPKPQSYRPTNHGPRRSE